MSNPMSLNSRLEATVASAKAAYQAQYGPTKEVSIPELEKVKRNFFLANTADPDFHIIRGIDRSGFIVFPPSSLDANALMIPTTRDIENLFYAKYHLNHKVGDPNKVALPRQKRLNDIANTLSHRAADMEDEITAPEDYPGTLASWKNSTKLWEMFNNGPGLTKSKVSAIPLEEAYHIIANSHIHFENGGSPMHLSRDKTCTKVQEFTQNRFFPYAFVKEFVDTCPGCQTKPAVRARTRGAASTKQRGGNTGPKTNPRKKVVKPGFGGADDGVHQSASNNGSPSKRPAAAAAMPQRQLQHLRQQQQRQQPRFQNQIPAYGFGMPPQQPPQNQIPAYSFGMPPQQPPQNQIPAYGFGFPPQQPRQNQIPAYGFGIPPQQPLFADQPPLALDSNNNLAASNGQRFCSLDEMGRMDFTISDRNADVYQTYHDNRLLAQGGGNGNLNTFKWYQFSTGNIDGIFPAIENGPGTGNALVADNNNGAFNNGAFNNNTENPLFAGNNDNGAFYYAGDAQLAHNNNNGAFFNAGDALLAHNNNLAAENVDNIPDADNIPFADNIPVTDSYGHEAHQDAPSIQNNNIEPFHDAFHLPEEDFEAEEFRRLLQDAPAN